MIASRESVRAAVARALLKSQGDTEAAILAVAHTGVELAAAIDAARLQEGA